MVVPLDTGDTAWVLGATALVLFMTPGLALFYGGMVRGKNVLGMLMQNIFAMGLIGIVWAVVGFSLAFGDSGGFATLVDGLSDGDIRNRYKSFESLKRATGQEFGYQHDAEPASRETSVARWKTWLSGINASARAIRPQRTNFHPSPVGGVYAYGLRAGGRDTGAVTLSPAT